MEADMATVFEKLKAWRSEEKKYSLPEIFGWVMVCYEQDR